MNPVEHPFASSAEWAMDRLSIIHVPSPTRYACAAFVVPCETYSSSGVAHVLEHLVFHTGESNGVGLADEVSGDGVVYLDALTTCRHTVYRMAATDAAIIAQLLARLFESAWHPDLSESAFSEQAWRIERGPTGFQYNGVVYNEVVTAHKSVDRGAWRGLSRALYKGLPEQYDSAGNPASLVRLTPSEVQTAHMNWYRPERSTVLLTGPVKTKRIRKELSKLRPPIDRPRIARKRAVLDEICLASDSTVPQLIWPLAGWRLGRVSNPVELAEGQLLSALLLDRTKSPLSASLASAANGAAWWRYSGLHASSQELTWAIGVANNRGESVLDCDELVALVRQAAKILARSHYSRSTLNCLIDQWRLSRELRLQSSLIPDGLHYLSALVPAVLDGNLYQFDASTDAVERELANRARSGGYIRDLSHRLFLNNAATASVNYNAQSANSTPLPPAQSPAHRCLSRLRQTRIKRLLLPRLNFDRPFSSTKRLRPGLLVGPLPNGPLSAVRLSVDGPLTFNATTSFALAGTYLGAAYIGQEMSKASRRRPHYRSRIQLLPLPSSDIVLAALVSFECLTKDFRPTVTAIEEFLLAAFPSPGTRQIDSWLGQSFAQQLVHFDRVGHKHAVVAAAATISPHCAWHHWTAGFGMVDTAMRYIAGTPGTAAEIHMGFEKSVHACKPSHASHCAALLAAPSTALGEFARLRNGGLFSELADPPTRKHASIVTKSNGSKQAFVMPVLSTTFARAYQIGDATPSEHIYLSIIASLLDRAIRERARTRGGAYSSGVCYDSRSALLGIFTSRHTTSVNAFADFEAAVEDVCDVIKRWRVTQGDLTMRRHWPLMGFPFTPLSRLEADFFAFIRDERGVAVIGETLPFLDLKEALLSAMHHFLIARPACEVVAGTPEVVYQLLSSDWVITDLALGQAARNRQRSRWRLI